MAAAAAEVHPDRWSLLLLLAVCLWLCVQDGNEVVQQVVGYKKKPLEAAVEQLAAMK